MSTGEQVRVIRYAEALAEAIDEVLDEDPRVVLIGARFTGHTPSAGVMEPVTRKHADRIVWPPISELAYCGVALGAAMVGMRPIVELSTATFSYEALPQIVNEAGNIRAMSNGQVGAPVMFHMLYGLRGSGGPQHSGSPQPWFWNSPGLQIAMPSCPADVKGLFRWAALRSKDPTMFMDHQLLMELQGPVPVGPYEIPFGQAALKRTGGDLTIIATSIQVPRSLQAAERLARDDGIEAEVVDVRTLEPLDRDTILGSVRKTGRAIVTDESFDRAGVAAGLAAIIADECFEALRAPIRRVSVPPVPVPYAASLEQALVPDVDRIVAAARDVCRPRPR